MADRIKNCGHHDCYCTVNLPQLDSELLQRYVQFIYHDQIFVIGGDDGTTKLKTVEVYDPLVSQNFLLQAKELITRRRDFAVTLTDDKIFVMGGLLDGNKVTAKTEMYDDKDKEWKVSKSMNFARDRLEGVEACTLVYRIDV